MFFPGRSRREVAEEKRQNSYMAALHNSSGRVLHSKRVHGIEEELEEGGAAAGKHHNGKGGFRNIWGDDMLDNKLGVVAKVFHLPPAAIAEPLSHSGGLHP